MCFSGNTLLGWAWVSPTLVGLHCRLWLYTINFKLTHLNIFEAWLSLYTQYRWRLQPECNVGDLKWRRLKLKHAWFVVCIVQTFNNRLQRCKLWTVVEVGPCINSTLINTRDPTHDLSVKLSPCMCIHSSCLGWINDWHIHVIPSYLLWRLS